MLQLVINLILSTSVLLLSARFIPGFEILHIGAAIFSCLLIGFMNFLIRPMLVLLTLAVTSFSVGLFAFILNALLLNVAGGLTDGFSIQNWTAAVLGALVMAIVQVVLNYFILHGPRFTQRNA